jgi:hypothetical protein
MGKLLGEGWEDLKGVWGNVEIHAKARRRKVMCDVFASLAPLRENSVAKKWRA